MYMHVWMRDVCSIARGWGLDKIKNQGLGCVVSRYGKRSWIGWLVVGWLRKKKKFVLER